MNTTKGTNNTGRKPYLNWLVTGISGNPAQRFTPDPQLAGDWNEVGLPSTRPPLTRARLGFESRIRIFRRKPNEADLNHSNVRTFQLDSSKLLLLMIIKAPQPIFLVIILDSYVNFIPIIPILYTSPPLSIYQRRDTKQNLQTII